MFSLLDTVRTQDSRISAKRKRLHSREQPVTFRDAKDLWIERLIELAVEAFERSDALYTYKTAYLKLRMPDTNEQAMQIKEQHYAEALNHFIACYVDFDNRFIDESSSEEEVLQKAKDLFLGWSTTESPKGFESAAFEYFQSQYVSCKPGF